MNIVTPLTRLRNRQAAKRIDQQPTSYTISSCLWQLVNANSIQGAAKT